MRRGDARPDPKRGSQVEPSRIGALRDVTLPDEVIVRPERLGGEGASDEDGNTVRALRGRMAVAGAWIIARDRFVLAAVIALAAVMRLPGLAVRGRFDGDQGHDMLTLLQLSRDGILPLLGPQSSVGEFHHGAFYYYLLAPSAWLSGADPTAVVTEIALLGIAAVALTWWLGRLLGGPVVALVAGVLLALSPAAIEESTFIWNPNPIPLFAAFALAAAWRGHETGRARWWAAAIGAAAAVVQLHVLGLVFVPAVLALLVLDVRAARNQADGARARAILQGLAGGVVIGLVLFLPLLVHEAQTGFLEMRRIADYLTAAKDDGPGLDPILRLVITTFRVVDWPLVGVVTDVPVAASLTLAIVVGLVAWRAATACGRDALPIRWLAATIVWSAIALTFAAPSLQTVVPGLPNDHYHAFLDPVVVVALALAGVAFGRGVRTLRSGASIATTDVAARVLMSLGLIALIGLEVSRRPPPDPNGGWPAANAAGQRIVARAADGTVRLSGLPPFKSVDGTTFPIVWNGGVVGATVDGARLVVVVCDRLFEQVMGIACGGPAEDREVQRLAGLPGIPVSTELFERFDQSPRVAISVYGVYVIATPVSP